MIIFNNVVDIDKAYGEIIIWEREYSLNIEIC